jgi:excisionase family DNA binding protein
MVTIDQAVEIVHVSARTIYRWVENGEIHFWETAEGKLLVCLNSLPLYPQALE